MNAPPDEAFFAAGFGGAGRGVGLGAGRGAGAFRWLPMTLDTDTVGAGAGFGLGAGGFGAALGAAALGGLADVVVDALADGAGFSMHGIVAASRLFTSRQWRLKHVAEDAHAVATRATSRDDGV